VGLMGLEERIRIVVDVVTDKASTGMASFRTSVGEADGVMGKFRAGAGAAMESVKANAGALAMAGGAALFAFGKASVSAFQDTALAAGKFSDATGVSVEEASKWRAVADDFDINADAIQGSILKMSTELGKSEGAFKQYGIEVVRAKDGTVDANATFINTATTIGAIKDPIERATAAKKLMGKSFTEVSRLMEMDAASLKAALDSTSEAQIIDDGELQKARDYQAAMDNLGDIVEDLKLQFGEALVPMLTEAANALKGVNDAANAALGEGGLGKLLSWAQKLGPLREVGDAIKGINEAINPEIEGKISDTAFAMADLGEESSDAAPALQSAGNAAVIAAGKADRLKDSIQTLTEKWQTLKGALDEREAFLNLEQSFDDLKVKGQEAWDAAASGAEDATAKSRDYELATIGAKQKVIDYLAEVLKLPPERATNILAAYDQGQFDWVEAQLNILTRNRTMNLSIQASGGIGYTPLTQTKKAKGGPLKAGEAAIVGDNPDGTLNATSELIVPQGDSNVVSAPDIRRALGAGQPVQQYVDNSVTTVNLPAGFSDKSVLAGQRRYRRIQGPT